MLSSNVVSIVKYLLEGLTVAVVAYVLPRGRQGMTMYHLAILALTATLTFALLDTFSPGVSAGTRQGAGFGIGYGMVTGGADDTSSNASEESQNGGQEDQEPEAKENFEDLATY